jgi:hypothetical protein
MRRRPVPEDRLTAVITSTLRGPQQRNRIPHDLGPRSDPPAFTDPVRFPIRAGTEPGARLSSRKFVRPNQSHRSKVRLGHTVTSVNRGVLSKYAHREPLANLYLRMIAGVADSRAPLCAHPLADGQHPDAETFGGLGECQQFGVVGSAI